MNTRARSIALAALFLLFFCVPCPAGATEDYARETRLECRACHVNPLGGGELTKRGEVFKAGLVANDKYRELSPAKKAVRLVLGYFHILAGVVWFGTIFYVHILLKPAYASKGLPKGELILGWTCIGVVGVTGTLLTIARMPDIAAFYNTRFGILLSIKIALFLVMAGTAALATFVLGPRMKARREAAQAHEGRYTLEELRSFDGKEGRKALVAVRGDVYDVTASRLWKNGKHTRHLAGDDLTGALTQAPHSADKLEGFPKVGVLVTDAVKAPPNRPRAVFYVIAYLNLGLVFLILAVVALWRWW